MKYRKPSVERVRIVGKMGANPSWCLEGWVCKEI